MDLAAQFRRGAEAYRKGDYTVALACSNRILETAPEEGILAASLNLKALSIAGMGNLVDSLTCLQKACEVMPDDARLQLHASRISSQLGVRQLALQQALRACELQADEPANIYQLARVYHGMGHLEAALDTARRCLKVFPRFAECWLLLAELTAEAGDERASHQALVDLLAMEPDHARAWSSLASRGVCSVGGVQVDEALTRLLDGHYPPEERATAAYALGRQARRAGQYSAAFEYCQQASSLLAETFPFDIDAWEQRTQTLIANSRQWLSANPPGPDMKIASGNDGQGLLFIVGMPRSGTTLCEQVLSSHPLVAGGGELVTMEAIDKCLRQRGIDPWSGEPAPGWLDEMRQVYVDSLPPMKPEEVIVTDKTPRNAERLGLIFRLFPRAKAIWMLRHPLDTILSCYFQDFVASQRFSNRLDHSARMQSGQLQLLRHWQRFFPQQIRIVHYSCLVQQLESTARDMAGFVGMEFHQAMLKPHLNPRVVRTSSSAQVRKPVYTSSLDLWRHYAEQVQGVKAQLQELKLLDEEGNRLPV